MKDGSISLVSANSISSPVDFIAKPWLLNLDKQINPIWGLNLDHIEMGSLAKKRVDSQP